MKIYKIILFICCCILLYGCVNTENNINENKESETMKSYGFGDLARAPRSETLQSIEKITKLLFSIPYKMDAESGSKVIAIDIENKEVYYDVDTGKIHRIDPTITLSDDDVTELLELVKKYNILDWKEDYSIQNGDDILDGTGWTLIIEYQDRTIQTHGGYGVYLKDIIPENYDETISEFETFIESRMK